MKTSVVTIIIFLIVVIQFSFVPLNIEQNSEHMEQNSAFLSKTPLRGDETYISPFPSTRAGGVTFTNVTPEAGLDGIRGDSYAWGD